MTAGQYHPEAVQVLAKTLPPEFIAVIGKPTIFTTKEGNVLTSIRAESMHVVDAATRDRWVVETAHLTSKRIAKLKGNEPDAVNAREHYSTDLEHYKAMVKNALITLKPLDNYIVQKIEHNPKFSINSIENNELQQKKKCINIDTNDYDEKWECEVDTETFEAGDYDLLKYRCAEERDPEE